MKISNEYFLMHKDIPVCLMEIDSSGSISNVRRNEGQKRHFPMGGQMNDMKFYEWWRDRAIPKTRNGAKTALQKMGYSSTGSALVDNLALSLHDCYWISPRSESLTWNDVNLFANDFVDTFGELTLNGNADIDIRQETTFHFATSQGELQKKWCIDKNGARYMVKGNHGQSYQQSLNELFATALHENQNFSDFTKYSLVTLKTESGDEGIGCRCYDFCSENVESISAWELLQTRKIKRNESYYYPLKEICMLLGMSEEYFSDFISYQIMTDYLMTNTDRHMNNIAILRNPDTLELLGFAPIYDTGNSMFYNTSFEGLSTVRFEEIKTHSFIEKEVRLLQYVQDRSLVDIDKADIDFSIYEKDVTERKIRIPALQKLYHRKMEMLRSFQRGKDIWKNARR